MRSSVTEYRNRREWKGGESVDVVDEEESVGYKVLVKIVEDQWEDFDKKVKLRSSSDSTDSRCSLGEKAGTP